MEKLLEIMRALRAPGTGCPWDLAQSMRTIVPHTLEEAYEVADAIEREAWDELPGELGDLLFQVVFYCQVAREEGRFDFATVVDEISRKLLRRHPHVFGGRTADSPEAVAAQWEEIKAGERHRPGDTPPSALDHIPLGLPALTRAHKLQSRAARIGFDWPDPVPVLDKVAEELAELRGCLAEGGAAGQAGEELGDLLFSCVNLARHLGIEPEGALREASRKFERRFRYVETAVRAAGGDPAATPLAELDTKWDEAKARGL
jgi:ATP diphosphatase